MSHRAQAMLAAAAAILALVILLAGAGELRAQAVNPLFGAPAPSDSATPDSPPVSAGQGGLLHRIEGFIIVTQRNVNREIDRRLVAVRDGHGFAVVFACLVIAFLYGVFHALGPGHGKTVIVGYFLGRGGSIGRGVAMAGWIALSHVIGAIVIVGIVHFILAHSLATPVEETLWLRFVSYGAILAIGLAMLAAAIRDNRSVAFAHAHGHGHSHDQRHHHGHSHSLGNLHEQRLLAIAAGFIPCSGAILILVFAFTNGILVMGMLMALFIAIGMGLTLAAIGIASVIAHHQVLARFAGGRGVETLLRLLGPLLITAIGALLLCGALLDGSSY